jgi:hypothetical protein
MSFFVLDVQNSLLRSSNPSITFLAKPWKTALTDHERGCFVELGVFASEKGLPLEALVRAINRRCLTATEGLVIGPGILGIRRCQWASEFGGKHQPSA